MSKKISFNDSLYRFFDPVFHSALRSYVEGNEFKEQMGYQGDSTILLDNLIHKNINILETEGTSVRFFVMFTFSFKGTKTGTGIASCICSWDIKLREKGLVVGKLESNGESPDPECQYGDDIVPIVYAEDYPKMAHLFRKKVFGGNGPETTGFMYAMDVVRKLDLKTLPCSLPDSCTGRIVMVDKNLSFRKPDGTIVEQIVKAGTILFDQNKSALMSPSLMASTPLHECFHWVFHRCAFELGRLYRETDDGFICLNDKTAKGSKAAEGNKFIEIQTNGVVPYILASPSELIRTAQNIAAEYNNSGYSKPRTLEMVLDDMRRIYGFSVDSMRRCLVEAGMTAFRGISIYQDDGYLQSFCFNRNALGRDESFCLPRKEMERLFKEDSNIRSLILDGKVVYVNGHLVLRDLMYVHFRDLVTLELTEYALSHADECFVKFSVSRKDNHSPVMLDYGLNRVSKEMERTYKAILNPTLTSDERFEARKKWNDFIRQWKDCKRRTFGETFHEIMKFRKKPAHFFEGKGLSEDQVYRLYKGESNPQLKTLVTIGGCLNMPYEVFVWFVEDVAQVDFYSNEPEMIKYKEFMDDAMLFKNIAEFDEELIRSGFNPLSKPTKAK